MTGSRIRVWLEPGYDGGRFGAWMLDWPGCFVWRRNRRAALAAVPQAVRSFSGWLAGHGERVGLVDDGVACIVEEVAARVLDDGYEINATFAADHRPVTFDEFEGRVRWLAYARADLGRAVDLVERRAAEEGPLGPIADGDRRSRSAQDVVRHIGRAEIWLAGRLDPRIRYAGPDFGKDAHAFLDSTRAWAIETLRVIAAERPDATRIDGQGETWTLAKVLRRLIYHSIDHLAELEPRVEGSTSDSL